MRRFLEMLFDGTEGAMADVNSPQLKLRASPRGQRLATAFGQFERTLKYNYVGPS
jgi:hypothetical protein